ncbi:Uncharacterized protein DBV15_08594 [Temnothorax longispinosus]|uniref:Uncharacterized protein n=1 Tax=Temnothorax longispinosus TaxID=300112 RepID=A0A4S2KPU4_9HYME|nr:Uncharacterized protein DBV15_08594 [Temnothorax longispinosus]
MTGGRMGAEGDPTTIIVYADVYTQGTPSTSEHELRVFGDSLCTSRDVYVKRLKRRQTVEAKQILSNGSI